MIVDDVQQAISIGECQHAYAAGLLKTEQLSFTLGGLVSGGQQRSTPATSRSSMEPASRCRIWPSRRSRVETR
jgi:hypothetical protein